MKRHKRRQLSLIVLALMFFIILHMMYSPFWGELLNPFDYREEIVFYANKFDLDPKLVAAVTYVESRFDAGAISPKGARGLMQLMPETALWAAPQVGIESYNDDLLFEPQYNLHIGTWYLSTLIKQFEDNIPVALAAYNGGRNRVSRWLNEGIWDGEAEKIDDIPIKETRNYVERVLRAYERYKDVYNKT